MSIIITGDLHIHAHNGDSRRLDDCLDCLKWIYDQARQRKINSVVFAGDFFHHRFVLSTFAICKAVDVVQKALNDGVKSYFLLGNHDLFSEDSWEVHSLAFMRGWSEVIEKASTLEIDGIKIDFIPYTPTPTKDIDSFANPSKVLVSHFGVLDAIVNSRYNIKSIEDDSKDKEVINVGSLKKWKKIYLGHYHFAQKIKNTEYVGSPLQLSFGEEKQDKHIIVLNDDLSCEYIKNDFSPRFHLVTDDKIDFEVKDAYIRIFSSKPFAEKSQIKDNLMKGGARYVEFLPVDTKIEQKAGEALAKIINTVSNKEKLIEDFLEGIEIPQNLDKTLLKQIGIEIVKHEI